jgi:hypothetical protein
MPQAPPLAMPLPKLKSPMPLRLPLPMLPLPMQPPTPLSLPHNRLWLMLRLHWLPILPVRLPKPLSMPLPKLPLMLKLPLLRPLSTVPTPMQQLQPLRLMLPMQVLPQQRLPHKLRQPTRLPHKLRLMPQHCKPPLIQQRHKPLLMP